MRGRLRWKYIKMAQQARKRGKRKMIDTKKLTESDKGRFVIYRHKYSYSVIGKIRSWQNNYIYVVYNCDDDWDNYMNYTAAATDCLLLDFIESERWGHE